jgi:gamma-glutamyltranspeptidase / glutathione hydrolase
MNQALQKLQKSFIDERFHVFSSENARRMATLLVFCSPFLYTQTQAQTPATSTGTTTSPRAPVPATVPAITRDAPELATGRSEKKLATAKNEMVAAAHPAAVDAGLKMLEMGGSAIDAAVAAQWVLNLVEAHASGIGGGAFVLHFDAKRNKVSAYDGRETAPQSARPDMFLDKNGKPVTFMDAVVGGRSVGVPGLVRVLELAHKKHGKLPWAALFKPAIDLAENGFPLGMRLQYHVANDAYIARNEAARAYFFEADGKPKAVGTTMRNPAFAKVLSRIAKEGADAFYRGDIAADIVKAVRTHPDNPGGLSEDDLAQYTAREVTPVCGPYRQYRLCGMPPPSSGGIAVLQILQSLEPYDLAAMRPMSTEAVHLIAEASRLAYADRERYVGDDRFVTVPLAGLTDRAYNRARGETIRREKSMGKAAPGTPRGVQVAFADGENIDQPSTSHLSIVDRDGNAVSMTTTIESSLGSRLFVHGFLLNNQLTDFSAIPKDGERTVANAIAPGKRPRSSMAPTLVFDADGSLRMVVGSPGGSAIINFVAKTLVATLDWNMDIQAAIALPNFGSRNGPTELEKGTAVETLQLPLAGLGHDVKLIDMTSGLHGIMRTRNGWQGGADPRREGEARGR